MWRREGRVDIDARGVGCGRWLWEMVVGEGVIVDIDDRITAPPRYSGTPDTIRWLGRRCRDLVEIKDSKGEITESKGGRLISY